MRVMNVLEGLEFHDKNAYAQPLFVDRDGRVFRVTLRPHQGIYEHYHDDSPFYALVLKGHGMFTGSDDKQQLVGPNSLLIFDAGENHSIRALDEELVLIGFMRGAPGTRPFKVGGVMAQQSN